MTDQLPATAMDDFVALAKKNRKPIVRVDGAFLKFDGKAGRWELGQEGTDVSKDKVIINSASLQHGFVRWGSTPPAKVWASISAPEPTPPDSIEGVDQSGSPTTFFAQAARQFMGKFVDGAQEQFVFNTNSGGGVERSEELYDAILNRAATHPDYCFPIVSLEYDFWTRATGKVYKPVFKIVEWVDVEGNAEGKRKAKIAAPDDDAVMDGSGDEPAAVPDEPEPARGRRRRVT